MKTLMNSLLVGALAMTVLTNCQSGGGSSEEQGTSGDTTATDTTAKQQKTSGGVSVEEAWATDTVLRTPESVLHDENGEILYVANINGKPTAQDGNGFISKLTPSGEVKQLRWVEGLNAPKGMGIYENKLYVTDINKVAEINIASGKVVNRYPVKGATFLNDITVGEDGTVYISDNKQNRIHTLKDGKIDTLMSGKPLNGPNGLLKEKNRLMVGSFAGKQLKTLSLPGKKLKVRTEGIPNADGVVTDGKGNYLVSNWKGEVYFVDQNWKKQKLLDTKADKVSAADIDYMPSKNLLLVPTFFDNRVVAYKLKY